jgi:hypothetical protein
MLARSRLPLYVMPLFVPLVLMLSRPLSRWKGLEGGRLQAVAVLTAVALLAGKGALAHYHSDRDSRSVAAAVRQRIDPKAFDGIVFLDTRPSYGLNVYLGRPVKSVPFVRDADASTPLAVTDDLCSELARSRRTLFAMKPSKVPVFRERAARCGGSEPTEIGRFNADGNKLALFMAHGPAAAGGA